MTRGRLIWAAILAALVAAGWYAGHRFLNWLTPELYVTFLVALGCAFLAARSLIEMGVALRAGRELEKSRLLFGVAAGVVGLVGVWFYWKGVLHPGAATLAWKREGTDYELLAPKMLGLALLAPFFLWMIGRSLADLPWPQRILSAFLRIAFVALLALGLSRLARTATTQKVCTVYLVDVSESVPDAAIEDARAEIKKGLDAKPKDALVRIITFAKRPRVVAITDDAKEAPVLERHDLAPSSGPADPTNAANAGKRTGLGAATDLASAMQLAYGQYPSGYLRRAVILTDGVQTDGDLLAEGL